MPVLHVDELIKDRVRVIQWYHETSGVKRAQLDVSGGVDSAVMLGLLAKAVGPDNVTAVYSSINSSENSLKRAQETAATFKVPLIELDITNNFTALASYIVDMAAMAHSKTMNEFDGGQGSGGGVRGDLLKYIDSDPTILGSFRSCIRAPIGRFLNRVMGNGIRHGTGNECEDRWLRFYQKGGDGEVDTNPIAMLSKGEVFQLAVGLGVPMSVLTATPSPDLQGVGEVGHNDEDELKALTGVDWTYSKVNPETGEYVSVGTIERMSRLADEYYAFIRNGRSEDVFFTHVLEPVLQNIKDWNTPHPMSMYSDEKIREFIISAKKIEKQTRHKMNPNCPSLGYGRGYLIEELGILTDVLPEL
jgi:NH3-dependent NAD+ synthetase